MIYPDSTGGIGDGKWVSVGDAALRTELSNGKYRSDALAVKYVPWVVIDSTTDNRAAVYAYTGQIYVPKGVQLRCNFLPDDDVTKFTGEGKILTRDPWGNEHVFDVSLATHGSKYTAFNVINQFARRNTQCRVGIVGDSITDGAYGAGWVANPTDANGDLSSTNYDHNGNGGAGSRFRTFTDWLNRFTKMAPSSLRQKTVHRQVNVSLMAGRTVTLTMASSKTLHTETCRQMSALCLWGSTITGNWIR